MRLLSFVPCGNRAGPIDDAPPAATRAPAATAAAADQAAAEAERRRRRRRNNTSSPSSAILGEEAIAQWRPALGDICELGEFNTDLARTRRGSKVAPTRIGKSSSWEGGRIARTRSSDEYRHLESASSMRPLAPTAFLF